ncbi:DUF2645 family protein [Xenorhabdus lircayensis]|uniref:YjeO family protein n=1 Tax=Xenorhabdus lircayensis TaxID=2763499 RepID=A0ABS0U9D3_9GAMM|nr:DUF2645 family protein [Xenorhabdus lircayensis]MBI6550487.1 YjeO family protein [Xenorhabdus lircayensis]
MKTINLLFCIIFILFSAILIGCFSTIDRDWMIGEEGINTVCDVVNNFVINDDRKLTAPLCFVFLLPFIIFFMVKGVKGFSENRLQSIAYLLTVVLSLGYWYWMFFGRFVECPFPPH